MRIRTEPRDGGRTRVSRRGTLVAALLIALATFALFAPAIRGDFVLYDDPLYTTENDFVRGGLTPANVRTALTGFHFATWQPTVWLSFMLDAELFGLDPRGFHLVNVLLHAANAVLLFALLHAVTGLLPAAAVTALLFAVHPLRVESVAWIAQRKDVLSALFGLLALAAYARYARRPRLGRHLLVTLWLALGLAAKPTLLTLPLVMLALDLWPLGRTRAPGTGPKGSGRTFSAPALRRVLLEKVPWLALCGAASVVAYLAQRSGGATPSPGAWDVTVRLTKPLWASAAYLGKTLWPAGLIAYYPDRQHPPLSPETLGAAALFGAITLLAAATLRRRPWIAAGWLWYLFALAPSSGFVPFGAHDIADRFTYLPMVGPVLAAVTELGTRVAGSRQRRAVALCCAAAAVGGLVIATRSQIGHWRDDAALFSRMVAVQPDNEVGAYGLAALALRRNDLVAAERHLRVAVRGRTYRREALLMLTSVLLRSGRSAEAAAPLAEAVELRPDDHVGRMQLGALLTELGRPEEARLHLEMVVRARPDMAEAYNELGLALARLGRAAEAERQLRRALALDPGLDAARANLAALLAASGRSAPQ